MTQEVQLDIDEDNIFVAADLQNGQPMFVPEEKYKEMGQMTPYVSRAETFTDPHAAEIACMFFAGDVLTWREAVQATTDWAASQVEPKSS